MYVPGTSAAKGTVDPLCRNVYETVNVSPEFGFPDAVNVSDAAGLFGYVAEVFFAVIINGSSG